MYLGSLPDTPGQCMDALCQRGLGLPFKKVIYTIRVPRGIEGSVKGDIGPYKADIGELVGYFG